VVVPKIVVGSNKRIGSVAPASGYTLTASLAPSTSDIPSDSDSTSSVSAAVVDGADVVVGTWGVVVVGAMTTVVVVGVGTVSVLWAPEQAAAVAKTRLSRTKRRISGDGIGIVPMGLFMKVQGAWFSLPLHAEGADK
jgi:hypothetical protein